MADLPPRDTVVPVSDGLMRWRPVFDRIEVVPVPNGKVIRLWVAGVSGEFQLSQAQADGLADLLKVRQ